MNAQTEQPIYTQSTMDGVRIRAEAAQAQTKRAMDACDESQKLAREAIEEVKRLREERAELVRRVSDVLEGIEGDGLVGAMPTRISKLNALLARIES